MENLLKKYFKGDAILWIVFIFLCIISVIEMYSASSTLAYKAANHTAPMLRHVLFLSFGAIIAVIVHTIPYRYIRIAAYLGVFVSFFLLIYVLFKGKTENDASRWIVIFGIQFQPSELAKLSVIVVAADLISRIKNKEQEWKYFRNTLILLALICPLILLENFSTAAILGGIVFIMMFIGNVSIKKLAAVTGIILIALVVGYSGVKALGDTPGKSLPEPIKRASTWVKRIDRFIYEKDNEETKYVITDENLQVQHGRIAIARGGLFGVMPGNSIERDYLPQAYSDFIYSIILEEIGTFGGLLVMLAYLVLLYRAGRIATKCTSVFPALLVIGLSLMIVFQTFVNMAVASSLIPVTGQPLPLISRGGTSILITCIYFGIILGITREIKNQGDNNEFVDNEPEPELPVVTMDSL